MNSATPIIPPPLPAGYIARPCQPTDAEAVHALIVAVDVALTGESDADLEDLKLDWAGSEFDILHGAWVVTAPDGTVVGYEEAQDHRHDGEISLDGYVHPNHLERGIGSHLLTLAENQARELGTGFPATAQIRTSAFTYSHEQAAVDLFKTFGYAEVRHFYRMVIDLADAPSDPIVPSGIVLRPFQRGGDDLATFETYQAAFRDHWNSVPITFEKFTKDRLENPLEDHTLWKLAVEALTGRVVGVVLPILRGGSGWVSTLAVLSDARGRGIGLALLQSAFAEFCRRGYRHIGLGVDAASLTGATRLYERAGMRVALRFTAFERVLRDGERLVEVKR